MNRKEKFTKYQIKKASPFLIGMNGLIPNDWETLRDRVQEHGYDNLFRFIRDKTRDGHSMNAIGAMVGVSGSCIMAWQDRVGIKRQPRGGSPTK